MKWDSEHGIWSLWNTRWFGIHGTTFRNAGYFNLTMDIGDFSFDVFFGTHVGVNFWFGEKIKTLEWKPRNCKCYGCMMVRPLSAEAIEALREIFKDRKRSDE